MQQTHEQQGQAQYHHQDLRYPAKPNDSLTNLIRVDSNAQNTTEVQSYQRAPFIANLGYHTSGLTTPIQGKMLLNQLMVSYLFDTGAELTVIARETYEKLNTAEDPIILREYSGPRICSVDGKVKVLGAINVKKCMIADDCTVFNAKIIVLDKVQQHDCLMGRDLIQRIPRLNKPTLNLKSIVDAPTVSSPTWTT